VLVTHGAMTQSSNDEPPVASRAPRFDPTRRPENLLLSANVSLRHPPSTAARQDSSPSMLTRPHQADHCRGGKGGWRPVGFDPCRDRHDGRRRSPGAIVACHPCQSSHGGATSLRFEIHHSEDGGRRNPPSGSGPWRSAVPPRRIGIRGAKPGGHGQFTRVMVGNDSMAACFCSTSKCR
jgi:hypothetical protein